MTKKRDNAYYEEVLERDNPAIYAELGPGKKYKNIRQARIAAGLIRLSTPLTVMKREWKKASVTEQGEFIAWIKARRSAPKRPLVDADGRLHPVAAKFIRDWLVGRKNRDLMREMGLKPLDVSVSQAANANTRLHRPDVIAKIGSWLALSGCRW